MALCFAKAMGEFGATITFVSNIPGETQTIPTAIYTFTQVAGAKAAPCADRHFARLLDGRAGRSRNPVAPDAHILRPRGEGRWRQPRLTREPATTRKLRRAGNMARLEPCTTMGVRARN